MSVELDLIVGPIYREIDDWKHYRVGIDGKVYTRYRVYHTQNGQAMKLTEYWHECNYKMWNK